MAGSSSHFQELLEVLVVPVDEEQSLSLRLPDAPLIGEATPGYIHRRCEYTVDIHSAQGSDGTTSSASLQHQIHTFCFCFLQVRHLKVPTFPSLLFGRLLVGFLLVRIFLCGVLFEMIYSGLSP
jgi:hypothetical protein